MWGDSDVANLAASDAAAPGVPGAMWNQIEELPGSVFGRSKARGCSKETGVGVAGAGDHRHRLAATTLVAY
ncbi:MAG: hypothetical protein R3F19_09160 [Verrucomicrobiales bacterium]